MSSSPSPDFSLLAARYDELRPTGERWRAVAGVLLDEVGEARRVLDVGCGTGNLAIEAARRGSRVWGVDPTPEMLEVARAKVPRGVGLREGRAEQLPFKDGWFDAVVGALVVHLVDRPRAFAEARRVLVRGGRIGLATFDPDRLEEFWVTRVFPSIARIDRDRFPSAKALEEELREAGFGPPLVRRHAQRHRLTREEALRRARGRHISSFQLLDDDEYEEGLARAERELPPELDTSQHWLIVVAAR